MKEIKRRAGSVSTAANQSGSVDFSTFAVDRQRLTGEPMDNGTTVPLRFEPIAERDIRLVEEWLDDPESRKRLGGMVPFRPCFEYNTGPDPDDPEFLRYVRRTP